MTHIHIGIVTFNSLDDLPTCIESIVQQTFLDLTIIIFDNASHDGTVEWIKAYDNLPICLHINPVNIGFANAHNQIIRQCSFKDGDFYMALNPDVRLCSTYIEELVSGVKAVQAGWGTGKLLMMDCYNMLNKTVYSTGHGMLSVGYVFNIGYEIEDTGQWESPREIWGAPATAVIISVDLIQSLQTIDSVYEETFFLYNEDTDFDWKARNLGWSCYYVATAIAYHRGGKPTQKLKMQSIGNRYLSAIKNASPLTLLINVLPVMVAHILVRCIITPKQGLTLFGYILKHIPTMLSKRKLIPPSYDVSHRWIQWARTEETGQPRKFQERLKGFIKQLGD